MATVGDVLVCTTGGWSQEATYRYQWQRDHRGRAGFLDIGAPQALVGEILTVNPGTWTDSLALSYQWQRDPGGGHYEDIPGETGRQYQLAAGDVGYQVRCLVTAANYLGMTSAGSNLIEVVASVSFTTTPADASCNLRCLVTAHNGFGDSAAAASNEILIQFGMPFVLPASLVVKRGGWRFVICDEDGYSIGEPAARGRGYNPGVARTETASFQVGMKDDLWGEFSADGHFGLKVYDSASNLQFYGPIIAEDEQDGPIVYTAADLSWRLGRRWIARDETGVGKTYTDKDPGFIIFDSLEAVNNSQPCGILPGDRGNFVNRTVTYLWKNMLQALNELGAIAGSYEWELRYEDAPLGAPPAVYLDLVNQSGTDRSGDVFVEYGYGQSNLSGYRRTKSIDRLATHVYVLGSGGTLLAEVADLVAMASFNTRYDDVLSFPDITVTALLDALGSAHVAVRSKPRETIQLPVYAKLAPRYGVDYTKGDLITARVKKNGRVRVDGVCRVWGASIPIADSGEEQPTLILEPQ